MPRGTFDTDSATGVPKQIDIAVTRDIGIVQELFFLFSFDITLVLLFVVSTRKQAGLWTELQPWMNGVAPTMTHRHQLYYGVGPNGEAAYYQYPAQGQPAMAYAQPQHQQQQYYGWQPQQQWQQHPYEAPGISPNVVPAGDPAHMLPANGPEPRYADQVHHEMKA